MYRLNADLQATLFLEKFALQIAQVKNTRNEAVKSISVEERQLLLSPDNKNNINI